MAQRGHVNIAATAGIAAGEIDEITAAAADADRRAFGIKR